MAIQPLGWRHQAEANIAGPEVDVDLPRYEMAARIPDRTPIGQRKMKTL
jgi:hypothetical protein